MKNGNGKSARFKTSADTLTLIEGLSLAEYGQVAPYAALSELIGRNVQAEGRSTLNSALNILERDYAIFFSCVTGEGVMRITEAEHLQSVPVMTRERINNAATRGVKKLSHLRDSTLDREQLTEKLSAMAGLTTLAAQTEARKPEKPVEKVQAAPNASKKALELFKKKD